MILAGENTNNAGKFTKGAFDISSRNRTAALVSWNNIPGWTTVGASRTDQQTTDLFPIIQEIVNRPGWIIGNSLVIIIQGKGKRVADSYDGNSSGAPILHVEYVR